MRLPIPPLANYLQQKYERLFELPNKCYICRKNIMNVKELRVGNLVFTHKTERQKETINKLIVKIDEIKTFKVNVNYTNYVLSSTHLTYDEIFPIPLTEEWLLKLNFKINSPFQGFWLKKFIIIDEEYYFCQIDYEGNTDRIIKIKYVHQLQNLYFALIGEELEIK